jgi:hypothetical protein
MIIDGKGRFICHEVSSGIFSARIDVVSLPAKFPTMRKDRKASAGGETHATA